MDVFAAHAALEGVFGLVSLAAAAFPRSAPPFWVSGSTLLAHPRCRILAELAAVQLFGIAVPALLVWAAGSKPDQGRPVAWGCLLFHFILAISAGIRITHPSHEHLGIDVSAIPTFVKNNFSLSTIKMISNLSAIAIHLGLAISFGLWLAKSSLDRSSQPSLSKNHPSNKKLISKSE